MPKLYIDTNVIIDAIEERKNKFGKKIGNPASDLFFAAATCKHYIVISDWTLNELYGLGKIDSIKMLFELTKLKIIKSKYTQEEKQEAKTKSDTDSDDALHIIIAEREDVDFIITRNIVHFKEIGTNIPIKKPEELL
ncbi:MAG: PIN domain-containing protein [Candidatus Woesearchaeota archaeon]|jgi:predicted nucleic acid-binding protein|nr:PIN domain-containing protein [Candidatus Woesearchaeota archaeon]